MNQEDKTPLVFRGIEQRKFDAWRRDEQTMLDDLPPALSGPPSDNRITKITCVESEVTDPN